MAILGVAAAAYAGGLVYPQWRYLLLWVAAILALAMAGFLGFLFYLNRHESLALGLARKVTETVASLGARLTGAGLVPLEKPASYHYLDSERMDRLLAAVGPRTSSKEGHVFEVIQSMLRAGRAAILRDEEGMVAERARPAIDARLARMTEALQDGVRASAELDRRSEEAATAEIRETAERDAAATLSNPPEFVLLVTGLSEPERGENFAAYPAELKRRRGPPLKVRVLVPAGVALPVGEPVPCVFGRVIERSSDPGTALTVEAFAAF